MIARSLRWECVPSDVNQFTAVRKRYPAEKENVCTVECILYCKAVFLAVVLEIDRFRGAEAFQHRRDDGQFAPLRIDLDDIRSRDSKLLRKCVRCDELNFLLGWGRERVLKHRIRHAITSAGEQTTLHGLVEQTYIVAFDV